MSKQQTPLWLKEGHGAGDDEPDYLTLPPEGVNYRKYTSLPYTEKPVADGNFGYTGRLPIKRIVFHTTSGGLAGTLAWFNNPQAQVSSNYVIDTDGTIYAMLEEYYVPYTNGNYTSNCETVTVECVDNGAPYGGRTDATYKACAALAKDVLSYYQLPVDRDHIRGHREESSSHPECPGNLDLDRITREAQGSTPINTSDAEKLRKITALVQGTGQIYKYKIREILQGLK